MAVSVKVSDYYEILGISRNSSADDVKRSYQQLIKKYHPDKLSDELSLPERIAATEHFHRITEAHSVLSNPEEKLKYDRIYNADSMSQDLPVSEVLGLTDLSYDPDTRCYSSPCRCGGCYMLTDHDVEEDVDMVCCSTCSLCIQILHQKTQR